MKPLGLTFAATAPSLVARLRGARGSVAGRLGMVVLMLALAALLAAIWQAQLARQRLAAAQQAFDAARLAAGTATASRPMASPRERAAWAELAARLNMPWRSVLDALEASTPEDVALMAVEPDAGQGTVRVVAESTALEPLLAYSARLHATPLIREVVLARHELSEREPGRPMRLHLQLRLQANAGGTR